MKLDTNQAAEMLKITKQAVSNLCKTGTLRADKEGRDWRIPLEEVERYARERNRPGRPRRKCDVADHIAA